ncbi:MAG: aminodeoxychorismate/anthranilate synthase component II [Psychrobacter sp.]|nr:aminodeoxychorismate/anthranilate synthase component II [Psychrobacter sp.]
MTAISPVLMIDNYDSFTYNIVQYLKALGQNVIVWRNDAFDLADIAMLSPTMIIIGPGPGRPSEAGLTLALINTFKEDYPILGICLGHQAIAEAFGAQITTARQIMHGRVSDIYHHQQGVFAHLPCPYEATRYHSLIVAKQSLPDCLEITAWTQSDLSPPKTPKISSTQPSTQLFEPRPNLPKDGRQMDDLGLGAGIDEIMGIRHRHLPIEGVQFHPESILSEHGYQLLNNFLRQHQQAMLSDDNLPCPN